MGACHRGMQIVLGRFRAVATEAIEQDGYAHRYASEELRGDRGILMEAVKQDGYSHRYASEELKGDREIVMEAVRLIGIIVRTAAGSECRIAPRCHWTCHDLKEEVQGPHRETLAPAIIFNKCILDWLNVNTCSTHKTELTPCNLNVLTLLVVISGGEVSLSGIYIYIYMIYVYMYICIYVYMALEVQRMHGCPVAQQRLIHGSRLLHEVIKHINMNSNVITASVIDT